MKKIYLIHGWGGTSNGGWFDWLKQELKYKAEVIAFNMPDTDHPKINAWVNHLKENIKEVNEETYFIGHSIGCQTIMRYLESLPNQAKVGGAVFVAGWFTLKPETYEDNAEEQIAKPWLNTPINFNKIKQHTNNFLALFSDNDPFVPLTDEAAFKKQLNAKTIIKTNHEHFNKVTEIPEILDFIGN